MIAGQLRDGPRVAAGPAAPDERGARASLRAQIARLERELADVVAGAFPHVAPEVVPGAAAAGPRLLDLGELERVRDDLAGRVHRARGAVARRAEHEAAARALLEDLLAEPARHRGVRLPVADLGLPGCGAYHVRPRLGLIGMLMGWWHVKLSSGCPSATGIAGPAVPRRDPPAMRGLRAA
ncbi:hypothetical protein FSW04_23040 [Baekduia soli]|uniref:Uncharacterized protein n=1 Tax=Baekduia soli TaxID=496014 RepID=A0A5B8UBH7_9ACTN|nr:hypothetical protein [Baekduia soli]QEC50168.1 hypothetical protein FSW04_23040 [Baekduia soli]